MVTCFDVCEILEMLSEASVKVFLDGGWGGSVRREERLLYNHIRDYREGIQRSYNGLYDRQPYCLER